MEDVTVSETTTYQISCTGPGGQKSATVTVNVEENQNFPTDPIDVETSGMVEVMPSISTKYRLTCDGPGAESTRDVIVSVPEPHATLGMLAALATVGLLARRRRQA